MSLIGYRAETIEFSSDEEMFETIGYIASVGRVKLIEAEVPEKYVEEFQEKFPNQPFRKINTKRDTPSGLPQKLGCQFRVYFARIENCPTCLQAKLGVGRSGSVARINKTKFVYDLVTKYGFQFGTKQDLVKIQEIARVMGYADAFHAGMTR